MAVEDNAEAIQTMVLGAFSGMSGIFLIVGAAGLAIGMLTWGILKAVKFGKKAAS